MTDERAKEIAEEIRMHLGGSTGATMENRDIAALILHLYDDLRTLKAGQAGLAFMSAGIQPVRKIDG